MRKWRFSQGCRNVHSFASHPSLAAVLVAISIPIFTSQLEKAREATDAANIRAAYAEVMTAALTEDADGDVTYDKDAGTYSMDVDIQQKGEDWVSDINWPSDLTGADSDVVVDGKATVTYTETTDGTKGTVEVAYAAKS